jgi:glycosyltransferase involved in cell wall biosynthesis
MLQKKILLITYYWPPSGGPGVQRWLKMTKYLAQWGCDITVITVKEEDASYPHLDRSLNDEVHQDIDVLRTSAFNPYRLIGKGGGQSALAVSDSKEKESKKPKFQWLPFIRSHIFIPDPRRGWNRAALKCARKRMSEERFDALITSSPPHSTQLIGYRLSQEFAVPWIMDLRDPWTDIFYYSKLGHSKWSAAIDRKLEMKCLRQADQIMVVGNQLKQLVEEKLSIAADGLNGPVHVVSNGYDEADFTHIKARAEKQEGFHVVYTGTLSAFYHYGPMFDAIRECAALHPELTCTLYGAIPMDVKQDLVSHFEGVQFYSEVSHSEINAIQSQADLLLLVIPQVPNDGLILTGKLFEYLRSGVPIMNLGPEDGDAAAILTECAAGQTFNRTQMEGMKSYLLAQIEAKAQGRNMSQARSKSVANYSRENLAKKVLEILGESEASVQSQG